MHQPGPHRDVALVAVPHREIADWPEGTFVENLAVLADGTFAVAIHNRRELWRVHPSGARRLWTQLPESPAGIVACGEGALVAAGEVGRSPHRIYAVAADGAVRTCAVVEDALFLNGMTPLDDGRLIVADSLRGALYEVDPATGAVVERLRHESLAKCSDEPMLPGANGVKARDGRLIVTNTDRATVLEIALDPQPRIDVVAEELRADDLAVDREGALYLTNHIHNTLIRLRRDGTRVAIAGPAQGMPGCTACTFHPEHPGALFVSTTGGVVMPLNGVPQRARLVRLEVGVEGDAPAAIKALPQ